MKVFSRLEEISERFIEGLFKGKGSAVEPVEIARKLVREMENQQKLSISKTYVPNDFNVFLSPDNKEKLSSLEISLSSDLAQYIQEKAAEKGYVFTGPVRIVLKEDENVNSGQIKIESKFTYEQEKISSEQDTPKFENTQVFNSTLPIVKGSINRAEIIIVRGQDEGMTFRLSNFPSYIGRRQANEVFVDDVNVSRKHASIDNVNGSYYLSDLDSLNGTFVNDEELSRTKLEDGDLIKIGTTLLRFRMVAE